MTLTSMWKTRIASFNNLRELIEAQISCGEKDDCKPVLLYQVPMKGQIGVWKIKGIADLIAIWPLRKTEKLRLEFLSSNPLGWSRLLIEYK